MRHRRGRSRRRNRCSSRDRGRSSGRRSPPGRMRGGFVDDHRQRVESLPGQHVGVGIGRDAVRGAQRVELVGELRAVGGGELGQFEAGARLRFVGAAGVGEQLAPPRPRRSCRACRSRAARLRCPSGQVHGRSLRTACGCSRARWPWVGRTRAALPVRTP